MFGRKSGERIFAEKEKKLSAWNSHSTFFLEPLFSYLWRDIASKLNVRRVVDVEFNLSLVVVFHDCLQLPGHTPSALLCSLARLITFQEVFARKTRPRRIRRTILTLPLITAPPLKTRFNHIYTSTNFQYLKFIKMYRS